MSSQTVKALAFAAVALVGASAAFVLTTVHMDTLPDTILIGLACVVAFVFSLAIQDVHGRRVLFNADRAVVGWGAFAGAIAFWAAPLLVLSQRATSAPSGSETVFFSTTAWGLACVLAAVALKAERPAPTAIAGALAVLAGAAGLLASWESPSSFSPFSKFPVREWWMLAAGVMFAVGALVLAGIVRHLGARQTALVGFAGAAGVGLLVALPSMFSDTPLESAIPCIYLGIAMMAFGVGWMYAVEFGGLSRASVSVFGVPIVIMLLTGIERITGFYGPSPVNWPAAMAGTATMVAGMVVIWLAGRGVAPGEPRDTRGFKIALAVAGTSCAVALISLAMPAMEARSTGGMEGYFEAAWAMLGFETAASWLAVAAGFLALAAIWTARVGYSTPAWASAAAASLICVAASFSVVDITLHTWNRWVPADVQQTYGTEHSRLFVAGQFDPVRTAALVLAVVAVAVLLIVAVGDRRALNAEPEVAS